MGPPARGDLVVIVLRGEAAKPRPAVVVQSEAVRGEHSETVLVCPLTSQPQRLAFRPAIRPTPLNSLARESEIMVDRLQAASLQRVGIVFGKLTVEELAEVDAALMLVLGLGATA